MAEDRFESRLPRSRTRRARFTEDVPVTKSVAESIGQAVVEWGRIEDAAGVLTATLLSTDYKDYRAVAANMMGRGKFDTLEAVAKLKLPARQATTIIKITKAIRGLQDERNRIVHSCWYPTRNPEVAARHAFRAHGTFEHARETVSARRIAGHTVLVVALGRRLNYALERQGIYRREPRS